MMMTMPVFHISFQLTFDGTVLNLLRIIYVLLGCYKLCKLAIIYLKLCQNQYIFGGCLSKLLCSQSKMIGLRLVIKCPETQPWYIEMFKVGIYVFWIFLTSPLQRSLSH